MTKEAKLSAAVLAYAGGTTGSAELFGFGLFHNGGDAAAFRCAHLGNRAFKMDGLQIVAGLKQCEALLRERCISQNPDRAEIGTIAKGLVTRTLKLNVCRNGQRGYGRTADKCRFAQCNAFRQDQVRNLLTVEVQPTAIDQGRGNGGLRVQGLAIAVLDLTPGGQICDMYILEMVTGIKSLLPDPAHTGTHMDGMQATAGFESGFVDPGDTVGNDHGFNEILLGKCLGADGFHAVGDHYIGLHSEIIHQTVIPNLKIGITDLLGLLR